MAASKADVVTVIRECLRNIEEIASTMPERAWSSGVYEAGWNARQLLCDLAPGGGFADFMIRLAQMPPRPTAAGGFDQDAFNAAEVAARQAKSIPELLDELRSSSERSIAAVEAAPDELLSRHFRAPWGTEGTLADVIIESLENHIGTHLAELRQALD